MLNVLADVVRRTRQHHAIEHATIHLLSGRWPERRFSGYSDPLGFTLYGEATEEEVRRAVGDALLRLQAGERQLAIHPNCGTNLLTAGIAAVIAGRVGSTVVNGRLERFTASLALVLIALGASRPLGLRFQEYTTLAEVDDRWLAAIRPLSIGSKPVYRVLFD